MSVFSAPMRGSRFLNGLPVAFIRRSGIKSPYTSPILTLNANVTNSGLLFVNAMSSTGSGGGGGPTLPPVGLGYAG